MVKTKKVNNLPPYANEEGGCAYCGYNPNDDILSNKKLLRKIAIRVVKTMYSQIEGWEPRVNEIKEDIKVIEEDIIKILGRK